MSNYSAMAAGNLSLAMLCDIESLSMCNDITCCIVLASINAHKL